MYAYVCDHTPKLGHITTLCDKFVHVHATNNVHKYLRRLNRHTCTSYAVHECFTHISFL